MNPNEAFAAAARPVPARILNLRMQTYSIGHEIILHSERNALLLPAKEFEALPRHVQFAAVIRAAQVCSQTWGENMRYDMGFRLWLWLIRFCDFDKAVSQFWNYRFAGSTYPDIKPLDGEGRECGAPFLARLVAFVGIKNMDTPLGLAHWVYFSDAEAQGLCKIWNPMEKKVDDAVHNMPREEWERIEKLKQEAMKRNAGRANVRT